MRLPLIAELDSRDGSANKDSRLTNALKESDEGVDMVVVRPGLSNAASMSGNGNGLVSFNSTLISVFGTVLGAGDDPVTIGTVTDDEYDFAQSTL